jgi:mono/diheme cytochrome c family protein
MCFDAILVEGEGRNEPAGLAVSDTSGRNARLELSSPRRRWAWRAVAVLVAIVIVAGAAFGAIAWRPELAPVAPPARAVFTAQDIEKGAALAAIGNCDVCHTVAGGRFYAGGRALPTPFGTIYATNITPDPLTGIGRWSEEAFRRALRSGVARDGHHLYPVFPYDHFIDVNDADAHALYAFLMTRAPVEQPSQPNDLPFPFNWRPALAAWKLLYLHHDGFKPEASQSADWNRGGYLVEGLAHCGACHTPRNAQGAERRDQKFAGGSSEGWDAPALNHASPAPVPWTSEQLFAYLRREVDDQHGAAAGPMAPVAHNLARVSDVDVRAIATYVASMTGASLTRATNSPAQQTAPTRGAPTTAHGSAAAIFAGACAGCHSGAPGAAVVDLALSTAINAPDARNAIRVVLDGITPPAGERGPLMPPFAGALTDQQIADVLSYVRERAARDPPWSDLAPQVRAIRQGQAKS